MSRGDDEVMPMPTKSQRLHAPQQGRASAVRRSGARRCATIVLASSFLMLTGCVSKGDFLRLQERVSEHHAAQRDEPDPFARIAQLSADVDALRQEVRDLQGELEVARKEAGDALEASRQTRSVIAQGGGEAAESGGEDEPEEPETTIVEAGLDQELAAYQGALDAWRGDDFPACVEGFTSFLQGWPESGRADDAAYWLADCTYKNGEFKRAVVRFNAVVTVYPRSPKAPDALYRQGESLLKLGPKFHEAARTVFKTVRRDYPDSERSAEAAQQLARLGSG